MNNLEEAIRIAKNVRNNSYDPYTKYLVGAALVTKSRQNIFWM